MYIEIWRLIAVLILSAGVGFIVTWGISNFLKGIKLIKRIENKKKKDDKK